MSGRWWQGAHTTQGHGIFSQYKPDHQKEWIARETRRQERGESPEKHVFDANNSLYRSSLHEPIEGEPIEHKHHAVSKSLQDLRAYQTAPLSEGHTNKYPTEPTVVSAQPLAGGNYLPHTAHHHHFGWNPPTPQARIAVPESRSNFYKHGDAQKFNQAIHSKASLISTRKA